MIQAARAKPRRTKRKPNSGPRPLFSRNGVYRFADFARLMGWGEHSQRQARLQGFPVVQFGSTKYVSGFEAERWFAGLGQQQRDQRIKGQSARKDAVEENAACCHLCGRSALSELEKRSGF